MKQKHSLRQFLALAGSSLVAISCASAQSNWTNGATGNQQWNTGGNWDNGVPNAIGAIANLSRDLANTQTVNLATGVTLGSLTYGDTTTGFFAQTIQGSAITFNNGGTGATLTQASAVNGSPGNIANNVVLNDGLTIVNNATNADRSSAMQFTGVISGAGGITINAGGGGAVYFNTTNGGNTYSGGFTLNGANAKAVTYQNGDSFGTGTVTINSGIVDTSAPGAASLLLTTSNAAVWNGSFSTGIWNSNGDVTLGNNVTLSRGSHFGVGGSISETGGARSLTLSNNASSVFNGTNTYTGGTTVSAGSLALLKAASMPSTGNVSFANGTTLGIGLGGDGWASTGSGAGTLAGVFQGTNVGVGPGSSTFSYTTAVGLNLIVTGNHTFGVIENLGSGATAFTKSGIGTLTITGDNTYTGATTVQGGGGLTLDYGSSDTSKFASGQSLTLGGGGNTSTGTLGGGSITLKGGTFTEVVSATSLNAGHMTIARDGGSAKLRLNAITRAAGGSISFADGLAAQTDTNNFGTSGANGVLGGWATVGDNWAVSANTGAADTAITALGSYTTFANNVGSATANYLLSGTDTLAGGVAAGTLKIDASSGSLTLGANNLTVTSTSATALGGIMYAGGSGGTYTIAGGGTGRIATSSSNQELIFAVQSGTLIVNALFAGNNTITKTGAGTMEIGATNTGNGFYYVNEGVLRLNNAAASGAAGNFGGLSTFVQNGAALELTGGFSFTNQERLMISGSGVSNGGALRSVSGANTWRGMVEIAVGGARINNDSAGVLTINNGIMTIAGGDVTFGGTGDTTVTSVTNDFRWGATAIKGGGGLIKDGAGILTLSGRNNYVGSTIIAGGSLALTGDGAITASPRIQVNASTTLDVSGVTSTFTLGAAQTLAGGGTVVATGKTVNVAGTLSPGSSPGTITQSGGTMQLAVGGDYNFQIHDASGSAGTGYDTIALTGGATLDLSLLSAGNTFNINLWSLSAISPADVNGDATSFNNTLAYSWTLFSTGSAISGFSTDMFTINTGAFNGTTGFSNGLGGGSFSVGLADGNTDLVLSFTPVPEPDAAALLGALGTLLLLRRRR